MEIKRTDKYKRYYTLKAKIRALETELEELKPEIIREIALGEKPELEKPYGKFSLKPDQKWKYSKELLEKEANIKLKIKTMKKDEEMSGKAEKVKDGYTLVFSFSRAA